MTTSHPNAGADLSESVLRVFGLAPLQEAILNAARQDPSAHVVQVRATIPSDIDVRELQAAWQHDVREFDVLRTSMHWEAGGRPLQVVRVDAALPWSVVDVRGLSDDDAARATEEFVARDARVPFDFATAPLCRCTCVIGRDATVLVVAFHHVAIDGWSMRVVLDFVARTFSALRAGERLPRSTGLAFADCVDVLAARPTEAARQVIRDMLRGFAPARTLRASLGAPFHSGGHALRRARHTLTVDRSLTLRAAPRARRVTLNTLFQAALAVLLARHGDTDRVAFGVNSDVVSSRHARRFLERNPARSSSTPTGPRRTGDLDRRRTAGSSCGEAMTMLEALEPERFYVYATLWAPSPGCNT